MRYNIVKFLIPLKVKKLISNNKSTDKIKKLSKSQKMLMYVLLRNKYLTFNQANMLVKYYKKSKPSAKPLLGGYEYINFISKTLKILR